MIPPSRLYLNVAPPHWQNSSQSRRFEFESTDFSKNLDAIELIFDRYSAQNPKGKIIVTVSPVPLGLTFSGKNIAVANSHSKSVLRAAAQSFADNHGNVDYFPSYELVALSHRNAVYSKDDYFHVMDSRVSDIIDYFINTYIGQLDRRHPEFTELLYLEANPDVDEIVRAGSFASGYEHWTTLGRSEGRPLAPPQLTKWMTEGGIDALQQV